LLTLALAAAAAATPSYADDGSWLCRPGRQDACAANQSATVVTASGERRVEAFVPAKAAAIDCFYVYPTVSTDPGENSDLSADAEERTVAMVQAARFGSVCRLYAPLYRQATLALVRDVIAGKVKDRSEALNRAYADVQAAWTQYLARDNGGRGVVLIGHSQGAIMLKRLLADEIEGKPAAGRLVSALLIGTNVEVAKGGVIGELKTPLCRNASQTGCVVSYVSFRAESPPPSGSLFGRAAAPERQVACTNPADLAGNRLVPLTPYFLTRGLGDRSTPFGPWTRDGATVTTPFVSTPDRVSARCVADGNGSYLAITTQGGTIGGDVVFAGNVLQAWGLHLIDMNLTMGDLIRLVERQGRAFTARP
jgi:hypothetical protein